MRLLYTLLIYTSMPFAICRLLWRSRLLPAYRQRILERFGWYKTPRLKRSLWIHTVSVGEFLAALPLIQTLLVLYPALPIVVTTTTPTGSQQVMQHLSDQVVHVYMPYDIPGAVKRFIRYFNPCAMVIMETELWPTLMRQLKRHDIPALLANARLSQKSARGYGKIAALTKAMLQSFWGIAAQADADADRFVALGAHQSSVHVAGNVKFDTQVPQAIREQANALKMTWANRQVLTAASTHQGEETILLKVYQQLKQQFPALLLLLVPRHPDRFDKVYREAMQLGLSVVRRTEDAALTDETDVYLGDTMGEMQLFLGASDIAFVGGSLVPVGGHNLIEPALFGLPTVTGQYLQNFLAVAKVLKSADALDVVNSEAELLQRLQQLLAKPKLAAAMGQRAYQVVQDNQGAQVRHVELIKQMVGC